ncbi:MAG: DUF4114 domain-containing protein [Cyanobacteria bacterium J06623_5]
MNTDRHWPKHYFSLSKISGMLLPTAGLSLAVTPNAIAQETVLLDPETGQVTVDRNAFDLQSGPLENDSNIPLPDGLVGPRQPTLSQPVIPGKLSPSTFEIRPDIDFIERSVEQNLEQQDINGQYTLEPTSLQFSADLEIRRSPGNHGFAEGIEATVVDSEGVPQGPSATSFVAGDGIKIGPDGETLPDDNQVTVDYGANDAVRVRVLNLQRDNGTPRESGVYFTEEGELAVEDLPNGGDRDFDDVDLSDVLGGSGQADVTRTSTESETDTETVETPLDPESREEESVVTEEVSGDIVVETATEEVRESGEIEISNSSAARLGHASTAVTERGEQLIFHRYARNSQLRAGSDGVTLSGQLAPLFSNPRTPPTLVSGDLTFNPTVGDNEAGLTATLGVSQFFTPTHRLAANMLGTPIKNADAEEPALLEPTGWGNNRRLVGYVPPTPGTANRTDLLEVVEGIVDIPTDQAVEIAPADPQQVGLGNAAYTNNVGGLLIESADRTLSFVPQWTESDYAEEALVLESGEARRVIYALVPQPPAEALKVGERYEVNRDEDVYRIAKGGFSVIAADQQPQNFRQVVGETYAVEDTLASANAATALFNGIRGIYAEVFGGDRIPTVDLHINDEVDAWVGNQLFALEPKASDPGQPAFARTTRAGGFYLGGRLTVGIGNQRDTVQQTTSTMQIASDEIKTIRTVHQFETPLTQVDTISTETIETIQDSGTAFFDFTNDGELTHVRYVASQVISRDTMTEELGRNSTVVHGEEFLVDTVVTEEIQAADAEILSMDEATTTYTDTYPNISPLQGELALGMIYNFGNTPWTAAANTVRTELFTRAMAFGQRSNADVGWRAEAIFHPFGEVQREAYHYDSAGNVVPLYQTEPVLAADGKQLTDTVTMPDGHSLEVAVNQFITDEDGVRFTQTVGTGRPKGPGVYLRLEDILDDGESPVLSAGLQITF